MLVWKQGSAGGEAQLQLIFFRLTRVLVIYQFIKKYAIAFYIVSSSTELQFLKVLITQSGRLSIRPATLSKIAESMQIFELKHNLAFRANIKPLSLDTDDCQGLPPCMNMMKNLLIHRIIALVYILSFMHRSLEVKRTRSEQLMR